MRNLSYSLGDFQWMSFSALPPMVESDILTKSLFDRLLIRERDNSSHSSILSDGFLANLLTTTIRNLQNIVANLSVKLKIMLDDKIFFDGVSNREK